MYTLQHLCGQKRASPEVQIYRNTLNDRISQGLQMIVLLRTLKEMDPATQNTYVHFRTHTPTHTHTHTYTRTYTQLC